MSPYPNDYMNQEPEFLGKVERWIYRDAEANVDQYGDMKDLLEDLIKGAMGEFKISEESSGWLRELASDVLDDVQSDLDPDEGEDEMYGGGPVWNDLDMDREE